MNEERFNLWCDTLVSGEIPQANGRLAVKPLKEDAPIAMCCLGVGSKCAGIEMTEPKLTEEIGEVYSFVGEREDLTFDALPPIELHHWLGLISDEELERARIQSIWSEDIYIDWPEDLRVLAYGQELEGQNLDDTDMYDWNLAREGGSNTDCCASLNDGGFTFAQIVDIMRYFGIFYDVPEED